MSRLSGDSLSLSNRPARSSWPAQLGRHRRTAFTLIAIACVALITILNRGSSHSQYPFLINSRSADVPVWHEHQTIARLTRPPSTNLAPTFLRHLSLFELKPPFHLVHLVSAWLDPRPLLTDSPPEVVLIASMQGKPFFKRDLNQFDDNPLHCYFSIKPKGGGETIHFTRQSHVQPQDSPDAHVSSSHAATDPLRRQTG